MTLLLLVIILALIFDFINGFHDAANSIATVVSTRVLTPFKAVCWAASFNFIAFFIAKFVIGEFGIANTVAKTVLPEFITLVVILAGLLSAITWNLLTWKFGIPSSSSHTLIGGFAGAAIASAGFESIHSLIILKIAAFIFLSPMICMCVAVVLMLGTLNIFKKIKFHKSEVIFQQLQLVSSALFCIGHGLNDSQKVMGIIAAALFSAGQITDVTAIPTWVAFVCFSVIALGTLSGGWRIIKTMGTKITKITTVDGCVAETSGALTLFLTEFLKIPVSTTHTIAGTIIGVGAIKRVSAVRWGITKDLLVAWILTIPISAIMAMLFYVVLSFIL
jgi:PiT family inorganic phosphate transporter